MQIDIVRVPRTRLYQDYGPSYETIILAPWLSWPRVGCGDVRHRARDGRDDRAGDREPQRWRNFGAGPGDRHGAIARNEHPAHGASGRSGSRHRRRYIRGAGAPVAKARHHHTCPPAWYRRAPEFKARCTEERVRAEAARDALRAILDQGEVGISRVTLDKYGGRVVADASTRATPNVSSALLSVGAARRFSGGHRDGWCP